MLNCIESPVPRGTEVLVMRIHHAIGADRLWYLREELMRVVACREGEIRATRKLSHISGMFVDVLPGRVNAGARER